ncbi:uncharacterized protein LOC100384753 [Zea mays]|uniref:Uncharacterized protein n=1 Tax=Zea mays TaxID=4577 RepID=C4IZY7_MAIZE|nr:uncharacterized protein LOC100384753 [Zea mays]ACR34487.1 unknown [Zea mays]|eukprot:NP_001170685.1 uncharacterized protein LOC100384753 [Zea mays]
MALGLLQVRPELPLCGAPAPRLAPLPAPSPRCWPRAPRPARPPTCLCSSWSRTPPRLNLAMTLVVSVRCSSSLAVNALTRPSARLASGWHILAEAPCSVGCSLSASLQLLGPVQALGHAVLLSTIPDAAQRWCPPCSSRPAACTCYATSSP